MKKFYTDIEVLVGVIVIIFCLCIVSTPIGYYFYSHHKENTMYEQFCNKYANNGISKQKFINILDRHPDGAYPVNPDEQDKAKKMSEELEMVSEGVITLDETVYLKEKVER